MDHAESFHQECLVEEGISKALGDAAAVMSPAPPAVTLETLVLVE
jgi:hypothetical protein